MKPQRNSRIVAIAAEPTPETLVSIKMYRKGKKKKQTTRKKANLATSVNLKLMSQRAFFQGKEL